MTEIRTDGDPRAQLSVFQTSVSPAADATLILLEQQFHAISAELLSVERLCGDRRECQSRFPHAPKYSRKSASSEENTPDEALTRQIEMILARLDPIEQAIMQTQARTIAGLGVKARHAAHVMSQYWEDSIDQLDWDARAVRLLVEAVCNVAAAPLPFRNAKDDEYRAKLENGQCASGTEEHE